MKNHRRIFIFISLLIVVNMLVLTDYEEISGGNFTAALLALANILWNLTPPAAFYLMYLKGLPYLKNVFLRVTLILAGIALVAYPVTGHAGMFVYRMYGNDSPYTGIGLALMPAGSLLLALIPSIIYLLRLEKHIMEDRKN